MAATVAAARKSRLHNALEGLALTATLQSFPTFATAAFLLKLIGNHDLVGDPGVAIFVAVASLAHAMLAVTLGPSFPHLFKTVYEPQILRGPSVALRQDHGMAHPADRLAATRDHRAAAVGDGGCDGERRVRARISPRFQGAAKGRARNP
ncbi:hypothetical protein ACVWY3_007311 [Bradyrhizobium sp. USDA 4486]